MVTQLQEARTRLATFEDKVKVALAQRAVATAEKARAEVSRKGAIARAAKVPVLIERPGRIHIASMAAFRAAYLDQAVIEDLSTRGRKAPARATELVTSGAIKVQLSGEGTALSLAGITRKTRVVDKATLRRIAVMQRKVNVAEAAASRARQALVDTIRREYEAGTKATPEPIAEIVGNIAANDVAWQRANRSIPWDFASDDRISENRKEFTAHFAHVKSKSKDPCPCRDCRGAANRARWDAENKERDAMRKAAVAA